MEELLLDLVVDEVVKEVNHYDELSKLTVYAHNDKSAYRLSAPYVSIGTYKNDNVKTVGEMLVVGKKFDLVDGEQGWGVSFGKVKKYYCDTCYFMPSSFEVVDLEECARNEKIFKENARKKVEELKLKHTETAEEIVELVSDKLLENDQSPLFDTIRLEPFEEVKGLLSHDFKETLFEMIVDILKDK